MFPAALCIAVLYWESFRAGLEILALLSTPVQDQALESFPELIPGVWVGLDNLAILGNGCVSSKKSFAFGAMGFGGFSASLFGFELS